MQTTTRTQNSNGNNPHPQRKGGGSNNPQAKPQPKPQTNAAQPKPQTNAAQEFAQRKAQEAAAQAQARIKAEADAKAKAEADAKAKAEADAVEILNVRDLAQDTEAEPEAQEAQEGPQEPEGEAQDTEAETEATQEPEGPQEPAQEVPATAQELSEQLAVLYGAGNADGAQALIAAFMAAQAASGLKIQASDATGRVKIGGLPGSGRWGFSGYPETLIALVRMTKRIEAEVRTLAPKLSWKDQKLAAEFGINAAQFKTQRAAWDTKRKSDAAKAEEKAEEKANA